MSEDTEEIGKEVNQGRSQNSTDILMNFQGQVPELTVPDITPAYNCKRQGFSCKLAEIY